MLFHRKKAKKLEHDIVQAWLENKPQLAFSLEDELMAREFTEFMIIAAIIMLIGLGWLFVK